MHDLIEDTDYELDDLIAIDFDAEIVDAVEAITKVEGEEYDDYLKRVKANPIARAVKLSDLRHNMDLNRLPEIKPRDLERNEKYKKAVAYLLA